MDKRERVLVSIPPDDLLRFLPLTRRDEELLRVAERYANLALEAWWAHQRATVRRRLQDGASEWFDG